MERDDMPHALDQIAAFMIRSGFLILLGLPLLLLLIGVIIMIAEGIKGRRSTSGAWPANAPGHVATAAARDDDPASQAPPAKAPSSAYWTQKGIDQSTAERLVGEGIKDEDGMRKAAGKLSRSCERAKAGLAAANDDRDNVVIDGVLMIDSLQAGEALSQACRCGRCADLGAAIAAVPDVEIDGWPYKRAADVLLAAMDALKAPRSTTTRA